MSHTLIVLPDDSAKPILDAINGATKSLCVKMFLFSHPELLKTVIDAKARCACAGDVEPGAPQRAIGKRRDA
jgi:hypothetical protein